MTFSKKIGKIGEMVNKPKIWLCLFLFFILAFGGTSQDILQVKLPIYILSILMMAVSFTSLEREDNIGFLKIPLCLGALYILLVCISLVPLPSGVWSGLAGRQTLVEGYNLAGMSLPWLPISMTPEKTLDSLFGFFPVLAIIGLALITQRRSSYDFAINAVAIFAVISVVLGLMQILSGGSSFYLYDITNAGVSVGFFSNANHQACFLAMVLPLVLYNAFSPKISGRRHSDINHWPKFNAVFAIFIILGILLTGSLAGYSLAVFSMIFTFIVISRRDNVLYLSLAGLAVAALITADFFLNEDYLAELFGFFEVDRNTGRIYVGYDLWNNRESLSIWGSGLGSFRDVFSGLEDRSQIGKFFIQHVHNDYVEVLVETGIPGILIVVAMLCWFIKRALSTFFRKGKSSKMLQKILLISMFCPIIHSIIDYPLRTPAIAALTAFLLIYYLFAVEENISHSS